MNSYADVLESYLIPAEEGFMDKVKSAGKMAWGVLKKAIEWIKERIRLVINILKNSRKTVSKSELLRQNSDLKRKSEENKARASSAEDTSKEMSHCLILTSKMAFYLVQIDKSLSAINREITGLHAITQEKDPEKLEDLMSDVNTQHMRIPEDVLSNFDDYIRSYIEGSSKRYASKSLKDAAFRCSLTINSTIDSLENVVKKFESSAPSSDDKDISRAYSFIHRTCNASLESLRAALQRVNKVATMSDQNMIWVD